TALNSFTILLIFAPPDPSVTHPLSLHDALPICSAKPRPRSNCRQRSSNITPATPRRCWRRKSCRLWIRPKARPFSSVSRLAFCRSEEHTSELQSHLNLVCRLLLEKKNNTHNNIL